jgi:hypothetical protein
MLLFLLTALVLKFTKFVELIVLKTIAVKVGSE